MAALKNNFPLQIKDVEPKENAELRKYFKGTHSTAVRVGPKGYCLPQKYREEAANIYNMVVRPSDIFIVTFPRSGTTWTQELIWLVANDLDFTKAAEKTLMQRFPFLEIPILIDPEEQKKMLELEETKGSKEAVKMMEFMSMPVVDLLDVIPSPRFIKSHLPLSLLPPTLLDTAKVVFVARDPRDVAVSFYHHNRLFRFVGYDGDFKTYWNLFTKDLILYTPFFGINIEAWEKRDHPNMLFLFYEELIKDLPNALHRVAKFLGKQLTEPQVAQLCEHLSFENFKNNKSITDDFNSIGAFKPGEEPFIRKGKAGGWRDYFDAEMAREAERWIADNLRGTDLRFPSVDSL